MKNTVHVTYDGFWDILAAHDVPIENSPHGSELPSGGLSDALAGAIDLRNHAEMAVLGIDVYRYSQFEPLTQSLMPLVLHLLLEGAQQRCLQAASYLFQKCTQQDFAEHYIDTGDGGFMLFDTPLHALIFAINFELELRVFNSFRRFPRLRSILATDVSLRYAMTYDTVFSVDARFYGPGIIMNGRMLSRDHLNRFLIDQNTFDWFTKYTRGIENLPCIGLTELQTLPDFADYDASLMDKEGEKFFAREGNVGIGSRWKDIDVLKLGDITVKTQTVCIYGLHIHYVTTMAPGTDKKERVPFTISLGNLNTSGID
ncbi:hypothetical protein [Candidatus Cryosericum septentrionale]|jgi:hypothetical protein|uniref:Uncharacterized protein n=1 Tax=Candidatus Cryosericum septentrionale TaxID=2290913 RepID=A0A398E1A9_9BACT|nr:hypothetical protein [Candidatus Cryosericum septentrionale]RIE17354.1 hypothetical protein SMC1_01955 [Candidatus Cryosericum septentrionale]